MLHAYDQRFDVTENLENFCEHLITWTIGDGWSLLGRRTRSWRHSSPREQEKMNVSGVKFILPLRACAPTLSSIGFALRSVQTHISMRNCFEMCVCTLLKANPMGERVRTYAFKGKKNCFDVLGVTTVTLRSRNIWVSDQSVTSSPIFLCTPVSFIALDACNHSY